MDKKRAQVFIATTKGLVQVQSITTLEARELSSVVTIAGTAKLAGISAAYRAFVEAPQGIIGKAFGGHAYRLNLSAAIDVGESWHLGVFIAHYLQAHSCLSDTSTDQDNNDIIIIATGKIDTLSYNVLPIEALDKKCVGASARIEKWQAQQQPICFLVPRDNFREPVPYTAIELRPIDSLFALWPICQALNLVTDELVFPVALSTGVNTIEASQGILIEANAHANNTSPAQSKISASSSYWPIIRRSVTHPWFSPGLAMTICLILLLGYFSAHFYQQDESRVGHVQNASAIRFVLVATLSEQKRTCRQGGISILNEGSLSANPQADAVSLAHLCKLDFMTSGYVQNVLMITDSKAIFPLQGITAVSEDMLAQANVASDYKDMLRWSLPLPNQQSQTRKYTLMIFTQAIDAADISSLDSFLYQLHQQSQLHTRADLQEWINKTQNSTNVVMLEHELSI